MAFLAQIGGGSLSAEHYRSSEEISTSERSTKNRTVTVPGATHKRIHDNGQASFDVILDRFLGFTNHLRADTIGMFLLSAQDYCACGGNVGKLGVECATQCATSTDFGLR